MECTNVLKRWQHSLMFIICNFAQRRFIVNNERLLVVAKRSTTLSRFEVVSNGIPMYLKVCTPLIASPSNTNSWHGSVELNTMTFVFFMFIISPRWSQNCWNLSNCCCSATSNFDIQARSFAKSNNHMCKFVKAGALHSLSSKRPSKASKYNPNSRGLIGQPCFTPYWHLKLEVTFSLGWLMHKVSLAYITYMHRKKCPSTPRPSNTCHNTSCDITSNAFLKSTKQQ